MFSLFNKLTYGLSFSVDHFLIQFLCNGVFDICPTIKPFTPSFLKKTLPFFSFDMSIVSNRGSVKNLKPDGKQCRSWWDGSSSGSTLFATSVPVFVYRKERVKCSTIVCVVCISASHSLRSLTLSLPHTIIIGFCKQHRSRWDGSYEPSHLDLRCLTFSISTLHINLFPSDSLF